MSQAFGRNEAGQPLAASQLLAAWRREDAAGAPDAAESAPSVRAALLASEGLTSAGAAADYDLAQVLGVPLSVVRLDRDTASREALARRLENHPGLVRYASLSPENAAVVRDGGQGLINLSVAWDAVREAGRDIGESWDAGKRQIDLANLGNQLADGREDLLPQIDAWYAREATCPQRSSLADRIGLTSAVAQLPRMLKKDLPRSAGYALGGAVAGSGAGAAVGSLVPGAGTAAGAAWGMRMGAWTGWLTGAFKTSFKTERGSFAAELSQERDENGARLDPAVRNAAALIYGAAAAAVETGGEALFLKLMSPLARSALSRLGVRPLLRSVMKEAVWDKSVQATLLDLSKRLAGAVTTESAEEAVQQMASILTKSLARREAADKGVNSFQDEGLFPPGSGGEMLEAAKEGAKAGFWLSGVPMALAGKARMDEARKVRRWTQGQKDIHAQLAQTVTGRLSPEMSENFLRHALNMTDSVTLPARAVLDLRQKGLDILNPLGWNTADIAGAAALGQELDVPLARLHSALDTTTFDAVADIMRPAPEIMNAAEDAAPDRQATAGADKTAPVEHEAGPGALDSEIDAEVNAEMERIRSEIASSVASVPGLSSHLREDGTADGTDSGHAMTPERAAEYYSRLVLNFAQRMRDTAGIPVAETLRRYNTRGLPRDENGGLLTPEEYEARLNERFQPLSLLQTSAENGRVYPNNGRAVGRVTPEVAATLQLNKPGDIVLDDVGLQHIEERHGGEIRSLGFRDGREFVGFVLGNLDAVYDVDGNGRKYDLVSRARKPQGRVMIRLEFAESGDFYQVATAGPVRPEYYRKKTPRWERAQSSHSVTGTPDAISGQSGVSDNSIPANGTEGKDLFQPSARASFTPVSDGYLIQLYEGADLSSLIHETGHFFQAEMEEALRSGAANDSLKADYDTLRTWLGSLDDDTALRAEYERYQRHSVYGGADFAGLSDVRKAEARSRAKREMFARGFEVYLREGRAPSPSLEGVFARFKKWLTRVYRKAVDLNVELTDEVRGVFDRLLSTDAELSARTGAGSLQRREQAPGRGQSESLQAGNRLAARFAGMPMIEADSSRWFGEGKELEVPAEVQTPGQRKTLRDALKVWAKKRFSMDTTISNAHTGWGVRVAPKGIEDSLSHGFDELLARSAPFIPQIIESGMYLGSTEKKPGLTSHIFANKIRLDGQDYVVGFVVREDVNGNRFYDHELTEIINPGSLNTGRVSEGNKASVTRANRGDVMNILRERLGVNDGTGRILFQSRGTNALGVPLSRVTRIEGNITREELDAALSELAGKDLPNLIEGITARVNSRQKRKLQSRPASDKSVENGFSGVEHRGVASQIANAWKWAAEARRQADKNGMLNVDIRRFVSALNINGRDAFAWITVKETDAGLRIYSVELMDEKKLRDTVDSGTTSAVTTILHRSFKEIIKRLAVAVKGGEGKTAGR